MASLVKPTRCGRADEAGNGVAASPLRLDYCVQASTSVMRLQVPSALFTITRILLAVTGAKVSRRHTSVFPVMTPPGTVCHAAPSQYSTVKSVNPYEVNVIAG